MELNLESARIAREVEVRIKAELGRLPVSDQKSVLERVALDVMMTISEADAAALKRIRAPLSPPSVAKLVHSREPEGPEKTLWEKILDYCQAHPAGKYGTVAVASAVMPEKMAENRNVARSMVFTAIKRRCLGDSDEPYFVFLGEGNFRLATDEERAKAKEKRGAA